MKKKNTKIGRPAKKINWNLIDSLAMARASETFIAERMLIDNKEDINAKSIQASVKLLQRAVKERYDMSFVQFREQKMEYRKWKLHELQWQSAQDGNVVMQIWLGKQHLGQSDKQEFELGEKTYTFIIGNPKQEN